MKKIYLVHLSSTSRVVGGGMQSRDIDGEIKGSGAFIVYFNSVTVYSLVNLPIGERVSCNSWLCGDKNNPAGPNPLTKWFGGMEYTKYKKDLFSSFRSEFLIDMDEETYSSCLSIDTSTMCLSGELETDTHRDILSDEAFDIILETIKSL